jgi:glucan phosphorylase
MKFVLNGGLIIGTCDGANIEVSKNKPTLTIADN